MKKKLLLFVVLTTSLMFAQLPDAPSAASRFSVSASAMGVSGSGSATASTIAGGEVNLTKSFAIGYEQVLIPSLDANYHFATVSYTMPLTFGKKINDHAGLRPLEVAIPLLRRRRRAAAVARRER
jgi:hypothetical protein